MLNFYDVRFMLQITSNLIGNRISSKELQSGLITIGYAQLLCCMLYILHQCKSTGAKNAVFFHQLELHPTLSV
jgi:hypothetical protein